MAKLTRLTVVLLTLGGQVLSTSGAMAGPKDVSVRPGVYSSTRYNEESGDALGMEVEVRHTSPPTVVVTICEGQCSGGKTWPAEISGNTIRFSVQEELTDQDGKRVKPLKIDFVGQLRGNVLVVRMPGASDVPEEKLKRVAHPKAGQTAQLGCGDKVC